MKTMDKNKLLLYASIGGYFLMSISFVLMPIDALKILPGLLFWGGLLVGAALQIVLEIRRRSFFKQYKAKRTNMQKPGFGLLTFCSNQEGRIVDYTMAGGLVATVLALLLTKGYGKICYLFIAITLYAFCLHCVFNGRIYFYVTNKDKVQQMLEQKRDYIKGKGERKK